MYPCWFDGLKADRPGRAGDSRDGTSGAILSIGTDRTTELSSDVFASLMRANDLLMQQLGLLLSAQRAKNNDLEKLSSPPREGQDQPDGT